MAGKKRNLQYGALPYKVDEEGDLRILLVTSRGTQRWIIPKGWPMRLRSPHAAAAQEAFEEAGVVGKPGKQTIGSYEYDKIADDGAAFRCKVRVFPLAVRQINDEWPEASQRRRQWFAQEEAAGLVDEPDLQQLLRDFRPPRRKDQPKS